MLLQTFKSKGMVYLDAPVSGGPEGATKGTLSIMVGGTTVHHLPSDYLNQRVAICGTEPSRARGHRGIGKDQGRLDGIMSLPETITNASGNCHPLAPRSEDFEAQRPVLEAMGSFVRCMGPPGWCKAGIVIKGLGVYSRNEFAS